MTGGRRLPRESVKGLTTATWPPRRAIAGVYPTSPIRVGASGGLADFRAGSPAMATE